MPSSRKTSPATPVRRKPSLDFSLIGLVYSSMMMFMGLAAVNTQANLLFGVFGLMVGVLLVAGVLSRAVLRRLRVDRVLPEHAIVGQKTTLTYHFRNAKRFWPSFSVALGELDGCDAFAKQPYTYMMHAAAGTTAIVPTEVLPQRRGLYTLDRHQLSTSFPFGFIKRALIRAQKDTLVVYPAIGQVDGRLLQLCRSAENTGAMMRPRRGGLDEVYGLKEYRQGDNPRWIYWKRSARTGTLVSKEMTQVAPPRLVLLVDSLSSGSSLAAHAAIERTIAMAASLAHHALEQNMSVGLYAWSGKQWSLLPPSRGKRHRRDILTALARLPQNTDQPLEEALRGDTELMRSGATVVLFTPRSVEVGLIERVRSSFLVISADSQQAQRWFHFPPDLDFAHAMPPDQQPQLPATN